MGPAPLELAVTEFGAGALWSIAQAFALVVPGAFQVRRTSKRRRWPSAFRRHPTAQQRSAIVRLSPLRLLGLAGTLAVLLVHY